MLDFVDLVPKLLTIDFKNIRKGLKTIVSEVSVHIWEKLSLQENVWCHASMKEI